jgi:hypothetical protein
VSPDSDALYYSASLIVLGIFVLVILKNIR